MASLSVGSLAEAAATSNQPSIANSESSLDTEKAALLLLMMFFGYPFHRLTLQWLIAYLRSQITLVIISFTNRKASNAVCSERKSQKNATPRRSLSGGLRRARAMVKAKASIVRGQLEEVSS